MKHRYQDDAAVSEKLIAAYSGEFLQYLMLRLFVHMYGGATDEAFKLAVDGVLAGFKQQSMMSVANAVKKVPGVVVDTERVRVIHCDALTTFSERVTNYLLALRKAAQAPEAGAPGEQKA